MNRPRRVNECNRLLASIDCQEPQPLVASSANYENRVDTCSNVLLPETRISCGSPRSAAPIYYLPVGTAARYCGAWATMLWTLLVSAVYCSYLYPVMSYEATSEDLRGLGLRILSLFIVAMIVQRFSRFNHNPKITSGSAA